MTGIGAGVYDSQLLQPIVQRADGSYIGTASLWLANCYFAHNSLEFRVLLGFCGERYLNHILSASADCGKLGA
jgi:hypothetical protein